VAVKPAGRRSKMKMDEIKIQMLNYDCNDIRCLNCGEKPKDGKSWDPEDVKSWDIELECDSVKYMCQCGLFTLYYGFRKTTSTMADYDVDSTQCHKCGSTENYDINIRVLGKDLVWEFGCCECDARWTEFYEYYGVDVRVEGGLLQRNIHFDEIIFIDYVEMRKGMEESLKKYSKRKTPDSSEDNLP
jgi:hypothetical protein